MPTSPAELPPNNRDAENRLSELIDTQGKDLTEFLISHLADFDLAKYYDANQVGTLVTAYIYELFRQRSTADQKTVVYYPGIGGGDQPFDILGAFYATDADEVYGVDLLNGREDLRDFPAWAKEAMESLAQAQKPGDPGLNDELTETDDEWRLAFTLFGKRRLLRVSKVPTNVSTYRGNSGYVANDPAIGPLLYERGTDTLVNAMAPAMNQRLQVLMVRDDYDRLVEEVQQHWQKPAQGLINVDFQVLAEKFKKEGLTGKFNSRNTRLLARPRQK